MPTLPAPDATVQAFSTGIFSAEVIANFWCVNKRPLAGMFLTATAPNRTTGKIENWSVFTPGMTEQNALEVQTEKHLLGNEVTAYLKNITVKNNTTGKTIKNCFAFFDADSVTLPGGTKAVNFTLVVKRHPSDVNGVFTWVQPLVGTVTVRREVQCGI